MEGAVESSFTTEPQITFSPFYEHGTITTAEDEESAAQDLYHYPILSYLQ